MTKKEFRQKWVEALRSGKYKQTQGGLCIDDHYCCLGVACEVYNELLPDTPLYVVLNMENFKAYDGSISFLPDAVIVSAGLKTKSGTYFTSNDEYTSLTVANDSGKTFAEIADIIESEPRDFLEDKND